MSEPVHLARTRESYGVWAQAYADLFGDVAVAHPLDRGLFATFADLVSSKTRSPVADLGCGPGHVTAHLASLGLSAFGIDLTPGFVELARKAHPAIRYDEGSMLDLDVRSGSLGGAVAWYSLIHAPPADVPLMLAEIARVLEPGGHLLVGLKLAARGATEPEEYDHKVVTAWRWPLDTLATLLADAGLVETVRAEREPSSGERDRQGYLLTSKTAPPPLGEGRAHLGG